jgi:hypothetical protein
MTAPTTGDPRRRLITAAEAALLCGVKPATIRDWVRRNELSPAAMYDRTGAHLFLERDVLLTERRIRKRRRT